MSLDDTTTDAPQFVPADIGRRLAAGIIDGIGLLLVVSITILVHIRLLGAPMPPWTIAAFALAWNVLPAWRFKTTLGLRLMGLEIVKQDGNRADLLEIAARELIGRGIVALAYLGTFSMGLVAAIFGVGGLNLPIGMALFLFVVAGLMLNLALLGQLAILFRPDRRSIADLLGRVVVVEAQPQPLPEKGTVTEEEMEPDELWAAQQEKRRSVGFVVVEVVLVAFAVGVPFVNLWTVPSIDPHMNIAKKQAAAQLETLRRDFKANPANRQSAGRLIDELRYLDEHEEADEALAKHKKARDKAEGKREQMLQSRFAKNRDWESAELLLQLYYEQERMADGRKVWEKYIENDDSPETLASFGIWLYQNDLSLDAVEYLKKAIDKDMPGGDAYAYMGWALLELERKSEARDAFVAALERDDSLVEDVGENIAELDAELGPRKKPKKKRRGRRRARRK
ncbi:RDD family protein [Myxococcota bacterium]